MFLEGIYNRSFVVSNKENLFGIFQFGNQLRYFSEENIVAILQFAFVKHVNDWDEGFSSN
jgi:hypothetical protein